MFKGLDFRRGVFHIAWGLLFMALIKFEFLTKWLLVFLIIAGTVLSFLSLRMHIPVVQWMLHKFEREENMKKFPGKGAIFFLVGIAIAWIFFSEDIALASIAILTFADPVSRFIGVNFGKVKHPFNNYKFIEGAIAGFAVGFLVAILFVSPSEAFFAALFAMIAEGFEIKFGLEKIDDNIIMPLVSSLVIYLIRLVTL